MEKNIEKLFILTINGKKFSIDPTGSFAIDTDGKAIKLADKPKESKYGY